MKNVVFDNFGSLLAEGERVSQASYPDHTIYEVDESIEAWRISLVDGEVSIKFDGSNTEEARQLRIEEDQARPVGGTQPTEGGGNGQ